MEQLGAIGGTELVQEPTFTLFPALAYLAVATIPPRILHKFFQQPQQMNFGSVLRVSNDKLFSGLSLLYFLSLFRRSSGTGIDRSSLPLIRNPRAGFEWIVSVFVVNEISGHSRYMASCSLSPVLSNRLKTSK
ncbi:hypothetical protein RBB80_22080 [Tunturiibacter gelidiferens]